VLDVVHPLEVQLEQLPQEADREQQVLAPVGKRLRGFAVPILHLAERPKKRMGARRTVGDTAIVAASTSSTHA
jgi:hypothetical protein